MSTVVQDAVDRWAKSTGMVKRSGTWYLVREETIVVLDLQKSNYASRYFLNLAVWLRAIAPANYPKEQTCHIRTRLGRLAADNERADQLLDAEWVGAHRGALDDLAEMLETTVGEFMENTASVEALRSAAGRRLLTRSLVTKPAEALLEGVTH